MEKETTPEQSRKPNLPFILNMIEGQRGTCMSWEQSTEQGGHECTVETHRAAPCKHSITF